MMRMDRTRLFSLIIFLLLLISNLKIFNIDNNTISAFSKDTKLNLVSFKENGIIFQKNFTLNTEELQLFINVFDFFIEKIEESENLDEIEKILHNNQMQLNSFSLNHPVLNWILSYLSSYRLPRMRTFVISHGRGIRFSPLKNHQINLYRPITTWHYSKTQGFERPARTFFLQTAPFNSWILHEKQVGIMTHFIGFYVYISQPPPQKSYTFFVGSANRIFGIDFTNIDQISEFFPLIVPFSILTAAPLAFFSSLFILKNNLGYDSRGVISSPIADFALYPYNPTVFEKIQFYDQSISNKSKISSWEWDFGDGNTSYYQNPKYTYRISSTYDVVLKVKDENGNTDKISKPIYVKEKLEHTMKNKDDIVKKKNTDLIFPLIIASLVIILALIFTLYLIYNKRYY